MTKNQPTIKEFRHKWEQPLLLFGYISTIFIALLCILVIAGGYALNEWTYFILIGLFAPVLASFIIRFIYYKKVSDGVQITQKQLPELYNLYTEVALKMGFSEEKGKCQIPPLYVVSGFGIKTFLSSKCASYEKYIVLKSDVANLIYEEENRGSLRFILAHHLAHLKCNHISVKRLMVFPIMTMLFLHKSLLRAEEYTADRMACYYFPNDIEDMINLHIKTRLGEHINVEEYFKDIEKYENSLFLRGMNFVSHGVAYRRIKTLKKAQIKGWNTHGRMF